MVSESASAGRIPVTAKSATQDEVALGALPAGSGIEDGVRLQEP